MREPCLTLSEATSNLRHRRNSARAARDRSRALLPAAGRKPGGQRSVASPPPAPARGDPRLHRAVPLEPPGPPSRERSEEHTSELQSQSNLVCRLLLEKKNNKKIGELIKINRQNKKNKDALILRG